MNSSRRRVLQIATGIATTAIFGSDIVFTQEPSRHVPTTASGEPADSSPDPKRAKSLLEQNKKDMKKDIEKLFQLATELKNEADKTDSVNTLSLALLRKTEEIEKLARQIRDKARG